MARLTIASLVLGSLFAVAGCGGGSPEEVDELSRQNAERQAAAVAAIIAEDADATLGDATEEDGERGDRAFESSDREAERRSPRPSGATRPRPSQPPRTSSPPPSRSGPDYPIRLSAGVALAQTGPEGEMMMFSVDYEFVSGEPNSRTPYVWVIEPSNTPPLAAAGPLEREGNLMTYAPQLKKRNGPFRCYIADRSGRHLSKTIDMH